MFNWLSKRALEDKLARLEYKNDDLETDNRYLKVHAKAVERRNDLLTEENDILRRHFRLDKVIDDEVRAKIEADLKVQRLKKENERLKLELIDVKKQLEELKEEKKVLVPTVVDAVETAKDGVVYTSTT